MFSKSLYGLKRKHQSNDAQLRSRQKTFQYFRATTKIPAAAPIKTDESIQSKASISYLDYIRLLFQNGISTNLSPTLPNLNSATVEKKSDDARAERLAAQEKRVRECGITATEQQQLLNKVNNEMAAGVEESKASVFEDSDDGMEIEEDQIAALLAARMKDIEDADRDEVIKLLRGRPQDHSIVIDKFNIDITVAKIVCLRNGTWLNDEVVNFYMAMLQDRDARLCAESKGTRLPSHYFNSFFLTKLMENGQYNYAQVKRWSKKFDVFALNRVFIPINLSNTHWVMAVVYVQKKEIHYYDSMSGSGKRHLDAILRWLVDEAREKKGVALDPAEWKLVEREKHVPQQQNGFDCGVFSIMCADYLSDDLPLTYRQDQMPTNRVKIAAAIRRGHLMY